MNDTKSMSLFLVTCFELVFCDHNTPQALLGKHRFCWSMRGMYQLIGKVRRQHNLEANLEAFNTLPAWRRFENYAPRGR